MRSEKAYSGGVGRPLRTTLMPWLTKKRALMPHVRRKATSNGVIVIVYSRPSVVTKSQYCIALELGSKSARLLRRRRLLSA